jgi:hypothetical protein
MHSNSGHLVTSREAVLALCSRIGRRGRTSAEVWPSPVCPPVMGQLAKGVVLWRHVQDTGDRILGSDVARFRPAPSRMARLLYTLPAMRYCGYSAIEALRACDWILSCVRAGRPDPLCVSGTNKLTHGDGDIREILDTPAPRLADNYTVSRLRAMLFLMQELTWITDRCCAFEIHGPYLVAGTWWACYRYHSLSEPYRDKPLGIPFDELLLAIEITGPTSVVADFLGSTQVTQKLGGQVYGVGRRRATKIVLDDGELAMLLTLAQDIVEKLTVNVQGYKLRDFAARYSAIGLASVGEAVTEAQMMNSIENQWRDISAILTAEQNFYASLPSPGTKERLDAIRRHYGWFLDWSYE